MAVVQEIAKAIPEQTEGVDRVDDAECIHAWMQMYHKLKVSSQDTVLKYIDRDYRATPASQLTEIQQVSNRGRWLANDSRFVQHGEVVAYCRSCAIPYPPMQIMDFARSYFTAPNPDTAAPDYTRLIAFNIARRIAQKFCYVLCCARFNARPLDLCGHPDVADYFSDVMVSMSLDEKVAEYLGIENFDQYSAAHLSAIDNMSTTLFKMVKPILRETTTVMYPNVGMWADKDNIVHFSDVPGAGKPTWAIEGVRVPIVIMTNLPYCVATDSRMKFKWPPMVFIGNVAVTFFNNDEMTLACINNAAIARASTFRCVTIQHIIAIDYGEARNIVYHTEANKIYDVLDK